MSRPCPWMLLLTSYFPPNQSKRDCAQVGKVKNEDHHITHQPPRPAQKGTYHPPSSRLCCRCSRDWDCHTLWVKPTHQTNQIILSIWFLSRFSEIMTNRMDQKQSMQRKPGSDAFCAKDHQEIVRSALRS